MFEIKVMSAAAIQEYTCDVPHAIISIRSPLMERVVLPDNDKRIGTIMMKFHDVVGSEDKEDLGRKMLENWGVAPHSFNERMARAIREFVEKHADKIDILYCQCEAGISRSAGIAAAVSKHMTGNDEFFYKNYHPNTLVYRLLLEAFQKK